MKQGWIDKCPVYKHQKKHPEQYLLSNLLPKCSFECATANKCKIE